MLNTHISQQDAMIATIFFIIIALVNKTFYDRRNHSYQSGKVKSVRSYNSFKYLQQFLRISTLIICLSGLWMDSPLLLNVFSGTTVLYAGIGLAAFSTLIFAVSAINLGENYSPCYDSYLPRDLIQEGLYKYIRHPIYTSNLLLLMSVFLSCGSALILVNFSVLLIYYWFSALSEEKELGRRFPKYKRYQKNTGMFIPNLKSK